MNKPYPFGDNPLVIDNQRAYRPNHNGTHSARQVALLDSLFDLIATKGNSAAKQLYKDLSKEEIFNLRLAAYFLRAGRVDESNHLDPPIDDYNTRSALIYENYAKQLGISSQTIDWCKKLIINSCKQSHDRDIEMDIDPKSKFAFVLLSLVYELDLVRCFDTQKMNHAISKIKNQLNYLTSHHSFSSLKPNYLNLLIQYAKDLCKATGCKRELDHDQGNRNLFMKCSIEGDYCYKQVTTVPIPKW